jgi:UDP-2,3-diacylglucosamine pyrophosphatase LpxH
MFRERLQLPMDCAGELRFCAWFAISGEDTLVTHGNQLDPYCLCHDPLHPFIVTGGITRVRLPFGEYASKYLSNGIGWFNPHVESTYVKSPLEWFWFFYNHVVRQQPLILFTWLWSSVTALWDSLRDGVRPALRDPLTLDERVEAVARAAKTSPKVVRALQEVRAHPAVFNPLKVARELWLDRFFLLLAIAVGSVQAISTLHFFAGVSGWWMVAIMAILVPPFFFYTARVDSDVHEVSANIRKRMGLLARITKTDKIVMGHTHHALHETISGLDYANTGHWAPGFSDVECTTPDGVRGFTWIRPDGAGSRTMELREWTDPGSVVLPATAHVEKRSTLDRLRPKLPWKRPKSTDFVPGR